ncbi:MAG: hypothetical protein K6F95_01975 [Selenomonas sp.]|uniref:PAS domain-containing sensor histidine kinase n=1 Tax=Selenomonas sp. TaxID=2053611 RepID=UPI0025F3DD41|nr:ATP-binding protein [Selenomonas sp.]MCR5756661.1 hypothetical protein [Selenomonas sp.]
METVDNKILPPQLAGVMDQIEALESRIQAGQDYMRAVFSAAKVGLCLLDSEGAVLAVNEMGRTLMQIDGQNVIGRQFGDAFSCENSLERGCGHSELCRHCPIRRNIEAAIGDDDFSGEFSVQMKNARTGANLWLNMGVSQTGVGSDKQIIITIVDVSVRRQYEEQLGQAKRAAEAADRSKTQFISTMSHEIRTPLNGLIGMIELAGREPLTERQQTYLQNAKRSADDLRRILNDILDFAKLENGKLRMEEIDFDLHETLQRMVTIYQQLIKAKDLRFVVPKFGDLPQFIRGDALRLRQILHNLLSNALKFTETGKITLAVYQSERRDQPTLEFSIEDTGIGVDKRMQDRLFRPFIQADNSTTRLYGGTGLGLVISKELVELMGGHMSLDSEPGRGTCVSFWIPLQAVRSSQEVQEPRRIILRPRGSKEKVKPAKKKQNGDIKAENLMHYCMQRLNDDVDLTSREETS